MIAAFAYALSAEAQTKKWDGEGGDGAWNNAKNWFPDGVPSLINIVELDHSLVSGVYTVYLPDGSMPVEAFSISIDGNNADTIKLIIPETNTVSPSINLYNTLISISIKNAAVLINRSGATAGNTFQMAGNFKIGNGGVYLHQTIRGTASIASKLVIDSSSSFGNFEMDVPGTAGYILSLSGRNYGTLTLNASRSGGKRSYSGSGNNPLNILGNLHIMKGASFITTLNGNIQLYGSFENEGSVQLNPTSSDTIDRSIFFKGTLSTFSNKGNLSCNVFLKKISIDSNAHLQLNTDFQVLQNSLRFELKGKLICNNFFIGGMGKFVSNKGAWISTSSATVLSSDLNEGNIRCAQLEINSKTGFSFTGEITQHTGNAFPDSISAISIHKNSNMVILDKALQVMDSLVLLKGILKSDSTHILLFSGKNIKSKNAFLPDDTTYDGYVSGAMEYVASQNDSLYFPIGSDTSFSPCIITATSNGKYHASFDASDHLPQISLKFNKKTNDHWHLYKQSPSDTSLINEKISLFTGNILLNQRENPVLIFNNKIDSNWKNKTTYPFIPHERFLRSVSIGILDGVYAIATQIAAALSNDRIELSKNELQGITGLKWQTNMTDNQIKFMVERCNTLNSFQKLPSLSDQIIKKGNEYIVPLPNKDASGFFRVSATVFDRNVISNIVYIENKDEVKPFPNPAFDQLNIPMDHRTGIEQITLMDMMGKKYDLKMNWDGLTAQIQVSHLAAGTYFIILHEDVKTKTWKFIKY